MQRLLDGDPDELRAKYLFDLAHVCHVSPLDVDALRFLDFVRLALRIDMMHAAAKKQAAGQQQFF